MGSDRCLVTTGFESLEVRRMLASTWVGGLSGDWDVAANWSPAGVPTSTTPVSIATSGVTVTIAPGEAESAAGLSIAAGVTLSMPAGEDPTHPTSNWIVNSDFELPPATNDATLPATWWQWGSTDLSRQLAYTGSQSLVVSGSNSGVTEEFPVTPGNSYTASVYAMTAAANPLAGDQGAYLNLMFLDASNAMLGSYAAPNSITILTASSATGGPLTGSVGNQGWSHFYTTAVAPANAAYVEAQIGVFSSAGTADGSAYFDDVELGPAASGPSKLVVGGIVNNGTLAVGPTNTVVVSGGFTQNSTGTLDIQLGGGPSTGSFGLVNITGTATLRRHAQGGDPRRLLRPRRPTPSRPSSSPAKQGVSPANRFPAARASSSPPP